MTDSHPRTLILVSENPMHDTGGGQRSAQLALEFLRRGFRILFLARGAVTETVDLELDFSHDGLTHLPLSRAISEPQCLHGHLGSDALMITQVPVQASVALGRRVRAAGGRCAYDLIDLWTSELGTGWYSQRAERSLARSCDFLFASAPSLVVPLARLSGRSVHLVPNAFNATLFTHGEGHPRPNDLPRGRVALYVGALWGSWLDWNLVRSAAAAYPGTAFVFIGDYRREGGELPPNCVFLGLKPQADLPGYLAHADLAFLPWRVDALTQATSPLKAYEFGALGLPMVAPDLEPLAELPLVRRASDGKAFLSLLATTDRASLHFGESDRAAFRQRHSWGQRVDDILALDASARSAAPNTPPRRTLVEWVGDLWHS